MGVVMAALGGAPIANVVANGAATAAESKPAAKSPPSKASAPKPAQPPTPQQAPAAEPAETGGDEMPNEISGKTRDSDAKGTAAGLPIPRFVSLRTNPINLRTGPGVRYPVDWVYVRRYLPVEIIGEFDTWRRIRDHDGAEGWVHQSMLSGKRTAVVKAAAAPLKRSGEDTAEAVATLEPGVLLNVQRCPADIAACRVEIDGLQGWMKREQLWGIYPGETIQ